jgi:P27 family predicted phage terminase small subunit
MKILPKPPKHLSRAAKSLFRALQAEYGIEDAAGLDLLSDYCEFYDRREQARSIIRQEGAVIKDRFEQSVPHPATRIERDSSAAMTRILRQLNLDLEPIHNKPGRPVGR